MSEAILDRVERYYRDKLRLHGATAAGVDWKSPESQRVRFDQLAKLLPADGGFSINDYGCGYAALVDYLEESSRPFTYCGYDICGEMIAQATTLHGGRPDRVFTADLAKLERADYTVASGIFNVKLGTAEAEWEGYVLDTIGQMASVSRCGFAFNVLTRVCDADRMRPDLYYASPVRLFDHCQTRFSRHVALLHDYPLWEFTVLVRL